MGAWGTSPVDNDTAADWFDGLNKCGVPKLVEEGLTSENYDEIRAAAWLFQQLGEVYVYDVDLLSKHRELAIKRLKKALTSEWIGTWSNPAQVISQISEDIKDLEARRPHGWEKDRAREKELLDEGKVLFSGDSSASSNGKVFLVEHESGFYVLKMYQNETFNSFNYFAGKGSVDLSGALDFYNSIVKL